MKATKLIDEVEDYGEPLYGFVETTRRVHVNLERLWEDSLSEEDFIHNYCIIYTHEYLHKIIGEVVFDLFLDKEEEIVSLMSDTDDLLTSRKTLFYLE